MLSVPVFLSPSIACFFMVSLEKSFVYKHLDNFLDFYANIAIVRGECMSRNGLKSFLIRFALQKKNFFFLLFSVVLLQQWSLNKCSNF